MGTSSTKKLQENELIIEKEELIIQLDQIKSESIILQKKLLQNDNLKVGNRKIEELENLREIYNNSKILSVSLDNLKNAQKYKIDNNIIYQLNEYKKTIEDSIKSFNELMHTCGEKMKGV